MKKPDASAVFVLIIFFLFTFWTVGNEIHKPPSIELPFGKPKISLPPGSRFCVTLNDLTCLKDQDGEWIDATSGYSSNFEAGCWPELRKCVALKDEKR